VEDLVQAGVQAGVAVVAIVFGTMFLVAASNTIRRLVETSKREKE
jgi:hypothetical protein